MNMRGYNLQGDTSIVSSVPSLKSSLVAYLIRYTLEVYTMESAFASDDTLMRRTGDGEDVDDVPTARCTAFEECVVHG